MLVVHIPAMNEMQEVFEALHRIARKGDIGYALIFGLSKDLLRHERISWDARCHFCNGPSYPWTTSDEVWAKVEPMLGQQQACFECFGAAWMILEHNNGEPFEVVAKDDEAS